jgi:DNA (cytosine-5)-methyltransferase 3A
MYRRYINYCFTNIVFDNKECKFNENIRNLTVTELERLQTVPEGYCNSLTYQNAVSLLGDGWTVDIIAHIFSCLKESL